jgi:hypothetical protein
LKREKKENVSTGRARTVFLPRILPPPDDQLRETFVRWYPGMQTKRETEIEQKAAQTPF